MPYAIPVPWGQLGLWASEYHREVVLAGLLLLMLMYCRSVLRWVFKRLTSRAAFTFYILGAIAAAVCCHVVAVFPLLAYDAAVWARSLHWSVLSTVLLALALILSWWTSWVPGLRVRGPAPKTTESGATDSSPAAENSPTDVTTALARALLVLASPDALRRPLVAAALAPKPEDSDAMEIIEPPSLADLLSPAPPTPAVGEIRPRTAVTAVAAPPVTAVPTAATSFPAANPPVGEVRPARQRPPRSRCPRCGLLVYEGWNHDCRAELKGRRCWDCDSPLHLSPVCDQTYGKDGQLKLTVGVEEDNRAAIRGKIDRLMSRLHNAVTSFERADERKNGQGARRSN
jgi:hypothetical protein